MLKEGNLTVGGEEEWEMRTPCEELRELDLLLLRGHELDLALQR